MKTFVCVKGNFANLNRAVKNKRRPNFKTSQ